MTSQHQRRRIGVCVDDFGMHWGINSAAIELANLGVVSAIGCMPLRSAWSEGALRLRRVPSAGVDAGLHLDIALHGEPGDREPRLHWLHLSAYSRAINAASIRQQIRRQFDEFEKHLDRLPAYVDGHRHVHQLPVVRDMLLQEIDARYGSSAPWVRSTRAGAFAPKALIIRALGGRSFDASAQRQGLRTSGRLLGVYGFDAGPSAYWNRLKSWLQGSQTGDVLMCHPARWTGLGDALNQAREVEFGVLRSPEFARLLEQLTIEVSVPSQIL